MKLKRFKKDNNHLEYIVEEKMESLNESSNYDNIIDNKINKIKYIKENWNDDLSNKFKSIKSMYYLDENLLEDVIVEYILVKEDDNNIEQTFKELKEKYSNHEAIKDMKVENNQIIIDLLCDTDIEQSCTEYNGISIIYNKLCEINQIVENNENDFIEIDEDTLIQQSIIMNESIQEFFIK
jgi:hypothetical protein